MASIRKRTRQQIFDSMKSYLQNLSNNQLTDFNAGSVLNSLLDVVAAELENVYNENYQTYEANYISTATGIDLENKASDFGLTRLTASYSTGYLIFGRSTYSSTYIPIPIGTIATTASSSASNAIQFETTEYAVMNPGSLTIRVAARARESGSLGNAAIASIVVLTNPPSGIEFVTNATAFSGGTDDETDEELRSRITSYLNSLQRGTKDALEAAAKSVASVEDAYVEENTPTYGFANCWVSDSSGTASDELLDSVQTVLEEYKPIGSTIVSKAPLIHSIDIEAWITLSQGFSFPSVQALIEDAIYTFLSTKKIGEDVYRSEIIDIIQAINGVKKVDTSTETLITSESATCTTRNIVSESQTTSSKKKVNTTYNVYTASGVYLASDTNKTTNYYLSTDNRNSLILNNVPIEDEVCTPISTSTVETSQNILSVSGVFTDTLHTGTNYYLPSGSFGGTTISLGTNLPNTLPTVYVTYIETENGSNTNTSVVIDYTTQSVQVDNQIADVKGVYVDTDSSKTDDHYFGGTFSYSTIYLGKAFPEATQSVKVDYWTEGSSTGLIPYDDITVASSSVARERTITLHHVI